MDACAINIDKPAIIQCIGQLYSNEENVCTGAMRVRVKPGSGWLRGQQLPLTGKEYLLKSDQVQIGTRVPGDTRNPDGILFNGHQQLIEEGRNVDGTPNYTLNVYFAFVDQRPAKTRGFRRCELDGKPLYVSGHLYLDLRS